MIANSHGSFEGGEARRPGTAVSSAMAGMPAERREHEGREDGGLHPPRATIATVSAVPRPIIRSPTFQLP